MPATINGVRDIPLTDLQTYPGNARRGNLAELRASLRRNGQYRPLVVRDTGGQAVILAGNNTYAAMVAEEWQSARCELISCTDEEARRIVLADNCTSDLGTWDDRALAELLAGLGEDLDGTGYAAEDVDVIFRDSGYLSDEATGFLDDFLNPGPGDGRAGGQPGSNSGGGPEPDGTAWVQVHWLVTVGQRQTIHQALAAARERHGVATAAEALEAICRAYLTTITES